LRCEFSPAAIYNQHAELLKRDRMEVGARIDTANPVLEWG
jgi:hypothetical protein